MFTVMHGLLSADGDESKYAFPASQCKLSWNEPIILVLTTKQNN